MVGIRNYNNYIVYEAKKMGVPWVVYPKLGVKFGPLA